MMGIPIKSRMMLPNPRIAPANHGNARRENPIAAWKG
jgi:hypothetical protein